MDSLHLFTIYALSRRREKLHLDLHVSATNRTVFDQIKAGTGMLERVNVFYEGEKITQIHAVFDEQNQGHNIDIYFKKKALKNFLQFHELNSSAH